MTIADKLTTVAENLSKIYSKGAEEGKSEERQQCESKHFVTTIPGSGETSLSFYVPFEPDALLLINFDTMHRYTNYTVQTVNIDLRALGLLCAVSQSSRSTGAPYNMAMTTTSVHQRYSRAEDGTITLQNIAAASGYAIFHSDINYVVLAGKYTDKTDKELFEDLVARLTGSGTIEVCQAKVEAAFTDAEWSALRATKPNWTFTFV